MIIANALPTYFMPMSQSQFPRLRKPIRCGGKGNYNHAYINNVCVKEDLEIYKKIPYHHVINLEEPVRKTDGVYDLFGEKRVRMVVFLNRTLRFDRKVGCDGKASLGSLMKRLQEIVVQHSKSIGLLSGGFCSTPEMEKRGLVWVLRKFQIDVEQNPSW
ncbi:hypothetical protein ACLB2K_066643 [Fragaria x ananassa]